MPPSALHTPPPPIHAPGLAIYNSHILEFSFPLVLFKKLTGVSPTFADVQVRAGAAGALPARRCGCHWCAARCFCGPRSATAAAALGVVCSPRAVLLLRPPTCCPVAAAALHAPPSSCPQELYPDIHQNLSKLLAMTEEAVAACGLNFTVRLAPRGRALQPAHRVRHGAMRGAVLRSRLWRAA